MKTAVVGLGNIGATIARNLVAGGQAVVLVDRTLAKAEALAGELGAAASAAAVSDAIRAADVVVLAVAFDAIKELVASDRAGLTGKVVVDPSNPIEPDGKGGFSKTIPPDQSSGMILARLMPEGAELVKAFGTLGAQSLGAAARRSPDRAVLFYATDFPEAGRVVETLITASGFAAVRVGGIDQSIRIEVGGELHEFGPLGRLVTASEAEALLRPARA